MSHNNHDLDYELTEETRKIVTATKQVRVGNDIFHDWIYRDGWGREVVFRGWNVSGSVKLSSMQFMPFRSTQDAKEAFATLREHTGANIVRFTIAWEGTHPSPYFVQQEDGSLRAKLDEGYIQKVAEQIKAATANGIYILLDYHQDLFSRHLFANNARYTGNGAPEWVIRAGQKADNGIPKKLATAHALLHWGMIPVTATETTVRSAFRCFWHNTPFPVEHDIYNDDGEILATDERLFGCQELFHMQLHETLHALKRHLSEAEFQYVLGVDPFNEPSDGELAGPGGVADWENNRLLPFYRQTREVLNQAGWEDKWVFAEPLVYWNITLRGSLSYARGNHWKELKDENNDGYIFNAHFYDSARMSSLQRFNTESGSYLGYLDEVRERSRTLDVPVFLSEYGMFLERAGGQDAMRVIKGTYQGMELGKNQTSRGSLYAPQISGTQWHWDIYYGSHEEWEDETKNKHDAWNDENFSAIKRLKQDRPDIAYNLQAPTIERAYPRYTQGNILLFHFNDRTPDAWNNVLDWASIEIDDDAWPEGYEHKIAQPFAESQFALLVWQGRHADKPTELYLPNSFSPDTMLVLTDETALVGIEDVAEHNKDKPAIQIAPDHYHDADNNTLAPSSTGYRLVIWDDNPTQDRYDVHFVLVVAEGVVLLDSPDEHIVERVRIALKTMLDSHRNPLLIK